MQGLPHAIQGVVGMMYSFWDRFWVSVNWKMVQIPKPKRKVQLDMCRIQTAYIYIYIYINRYIYIYRYAICTYIYIYIYIYHPVLRPPTPPPPPMSTLDALDRWGSLRTFWICPFPATRSHFFMCAHSSFVLCRRASFQLVSVPRQFLLNPHT